jgi:uncharacterized protein (TIGR03083 family)
VDSADLLEAFHREAAALAAAAGRDLRAALPCCPGWTATDLLVHLATIYASITRNIREGQGEDIVHELDDLRLEPAYEEWLRRDRAAAHRPPDLDDWYGRCAGALEDAFREAGPDAVTWTWWEQNQTVGFWIRRMAHETVVHRWDVESAHGEGNPIDAPLAADGVEEALQIYQPRWCRGQSRLAGRGETYLFAATDVDGAWLVRFPVEGGMEVDAAGGAGAEVRLRGSASDLLLFLWHRIPAERLEISGDAELLGRYFELVPPD